MIERMTISIPPEIAKKVRKYRAKKILKTGENWSNSYTIATLLEEALDNEN